MKTSELPKGSVVELGDGQQYEKYVTDWIGLYEEAEDPILLEDMDIRTDVKIVSVPYEVTLKLAEWLDTVYTKSGKPESLVIEAAYSAAKNKHDSHISDRPKSVGVEETWRTIPGFEGYKMNLSKDIADTLCGNALVPLVEKEGLKHAQPSVLLRTDDGSCGHMNVTYLFRQTYPELTKKKVV
jgi:hypothetical protein